MKTGRTGVCFLMLLVGTPQTAGQERRLAVASGEHLHVVDSGQGEPVVLLPGMLGSAFGFRKLTALLVEAGRRVIVVEPIGFGRSSRPRDADYSLTAQAERVARAVEALGADPAVVVGHGVGASVALRLAARHPDRVRAVVSLDGGPAEAAATSGIRRAMRFAFFIKLFGGQDALRRTVRSTLEECSADPRWVTEDVVEGYVAAAAPDVGGTVDVFRRMARAREPELLAPALPRVRCPVRLVIGDAAREKGVSEDEIRLLAESLPSFTVERVAGAGHFLFEENPEAVAAAVERASSSAPLEKRVATAPR